MENSTPKELTIKSINDFLENEIICCTEDILSVFDEFKKNILPLVLIINEHSKTQVEMGCLTKVKWGRTYKEEAYIDNFWVSIDNCKVFVSDARSQPYIKAEKDCVRFVLQLIQNGTLFDKSS